MATQKLLLTTVLRRQPVDTVNNFYLPLWQRGNSPRARHFTGFREAKTLAPQVPCRSNSWRGTETATASLQSSAMILDPLLNGNNNDKNKGERTQKQRQTDNGLQAHSTIGKCSRSQPAPAGVLWSMARSCLPEDHHGGEEGDKLRDRGGRACRRVPPHRLEILSQAVVAGGRRLGLVSHGRVAPSGPNSRRPLRKDRSIL